MKLIGVTTAMLLSVHAEAWTAKKEIDKMTDEKIIQITQASKNSVGSNRPAHLAVVINCKNERWILGLSHPRLVGKGPAKLRVNQEGPFPVYAAPSADRKILLIGDQSSSGGENPKALIERIKDANNLVVQYEDITGKIHQADFSMKGLAGKLKSPCK